MVSSSRRSALGALFASALAASCHRGNGTGEPIDGGPDVVTIRAPAELPAPGNAPDNSQIEVPLTSVFLPEEPVATGAVPNVIAVARVPCNYHPYIAYAERDGSAFRVRLRARYDGPGVPPAVPGEGCTESNPTARSVSLGRVRTGVYDVTDGVPHGPGTPPVPHATLRVLATDDPLLQRAPSVNRACSTDADCAGGGACGAVGARRVCAPQVDPDLAQGPSCPQGTATVVLTALSSPADAGPPAPPWRACLYGCDPHDRCPPATQCVEVVPGQKACVP